MHCDKIHTGKTSKYNEENDFDFVSAYWEWLHATFTLCINVRSHYCMLGSHVNSLWSESWSNMPYLVWMLSDQTAGPPTNHLPTDSQSQVNQSQFWYYYPDNVSAHWDYVKGAYTFMMRKLRFPEHLKTTWIASLSGGRYVFGREIQTGTTPLLRLTHSFSVSNVAIVTFVHSSHRSVKVELVRFKCKRISQVLMNLGGATNRLTHSPERRLHRLCGLSGFLSSVNPSVWHSATFTVCVSLESVTLFVSVSHNLLSEREQTPSNKLVLQSSFSHNFIINICLRCHDGPLYI